MNNKKVGMRLSTGSFGKVYCLENTDGRPTQEVLKILRKRPSLKLSDLKDITQNIELMRMLSSEEWKHENITKLLGVYQSATHVLFHMEFNGRLDLNQRL